MNKEMIGTLKPDGSYDRRPSVDVRGVKIGHKMVHSTFRLDTTHFVVVPRRYELTKERKAALKLLPGSGSSRSPKASAKASEDN